MIRLAATVKQAAKRTLLSSRVLRTAARLAPAGAVVLMYHSVQPDPRDLADRIGPAIAHPAELFDRQMELLARQFTPVTLDALADFLSGRGKLPARAVAVTFDDGFRDNLEHAAPILRRHGVPAAFYVTAGCVAEGRDPWFCRIRRAFVTTAARQWTDPADGHAWNLDLEPLRLEAQLAALRHCAVLTGPRQEAWIAAIERDLATPPPADGGLMLTWDQVRALAEQGHLIGAHSLSHPNLAHLPEEEARREICDCRRLLEEQLGRPVRHFSYPCAILEPHWNAQTVALTRDAGYATVTTTATGRVAAHCDPRLLPRVAAPLEIEDFRWALEVTLLGHKL